MAQQTRTGQDIPAALTGPDGQGWRGRYGPAVPLLGYDIGYQDGFNAAHGDGSGPTISAFIPEGGEISIDSEVARYTPIEFTVADTDGIAGIVVSVWFDGEPYPSMAYDLSTGFYGLFGVVRAGVTPSTATLTPGPTLPTEAAFSLLPAGGWRRTVLAIAVSAWDRGGSASYVLNPGVRSGGGS
jgi:hypothetical protein